jgi:hypothetical protein
MSLQQVKYPSRWVPRDTCTDDDVAADGIDSQSVKIMDHLVVTKHRGFSVKRTN